MPSENEVIAARQASRGTAQKARRVQRDVMRAGASQDLEIVNERGKKVIRPAQGGPIVPKHVVSRSCVRMREQLELIAEQVQHLAAVKVGVEEACAALEALVTEADE